MLFSFPTAKMRQKCPAEKKEKAPTAKGKEKAPTCVGWGDGDPSPS